MAEINKIKLGSTTYDLEDTEARGDVADLKGAVGNLSQLHTDVKTNIVNAINEVNDYLEGGIEDAVDLWLNDHPEATTTVQDHSLTYEKLVNGTLGFVTPEMYGAYGDGIHDDTTALQACLVNGNNVLLTKTYLVTSTLDINYKHDISIYGGKIVRPANQAFNTIRGKGAYNINIENVEFDGNGNDSSFVQDWPNANQVCIFIGSQSKNIRLIDCRIYNYFYGVYILGYDAENATASFDNTSLNGVIRDCVFYNCHKPIDTYGKGLIIDHNIFYGNTGLSIQIEPNGASTSDNPLTDVNYFTSGAGTVITQNLFIDNGVFDIKVFPNNYGVIIDSNTFINYNQAIIAEFNDSSKGTIITKNVLIYQKRQEITDSKKPWTYIPSISVRGRGVAVNDNSIYSPVVGIFTSGALEICGNRIDKPEISGIVVFDGGTNRPKIKTIRGNIISEHTLASGAWWACFAMVIGEAGDTEMYVITDNVIESTSRPIYVASGKKAYVKNLISTSQQTEVTKPDGIYDYSN